MIFVTWGHLSEPLKSPPVSPVPAALRPGELSDAKLEKLSVETPRHRLDGRLSLHHRLSWCSKYTWILHMLPTCYRSQCHWPMPGTCLLATASRNNFGPLSSSPTRWAQLDAIFYWLAGLARIFSEANTKMERFASAAPAWLPQICYVWRKQSQAHLQCRFWRFRANLAILGFPRGAWAELLTFESKYTKVIQSESRNQQFQLIPHLAQWGYLMFWKEYSYFSFWSFSSWSSASFSVLLQLLLRR